jgi:hypothetical protein
MPFWSYEHAVSRANVSFLIINTEAFLLNNYRALSDTIMVLFS